MRKFDFVTPSCITKTELSRRCSTPAGVSRLDLALGHKLHTMTENLHALSADGPRFLRTLDLTNCSVVEVHEVRHRQRIRRRWRFSEPSLHMQRSSVLDNGHFLVQFPKRSGIPWKRIAHKEFGTVSRRRCCWNSPKADVRFSVERLHCPGGISEAKDTESCRFTPLPTRKQLRPFFA